VKSLDVPFNMQTKVNDSLREEPLDHNQMEKGVDWILDQMKSSEDSDFIAGQSAAVGSFYRILGDLEKSQMYLEDALKYFGDNGQKGQELITNLRLATTYHWMGKFGKAENMLAQIISFIIEKNNKKLAGYLDFAYLSLGKCLFDQKRYSESQDYFLKSLDIRLQKGNVELIEATQFALEKVRAFTS
jgi:tetratricopeptide (TPR) repeat protein